MCKRVDRRKQLLAGEEAQVRFGVQMATSSVPATGDDSTDLANVWAASFEPSVMAQRAREETYQTYAVSGMAVAAYDALALVAMSGPGRALELDHRRGGVMRTPPADVELFRKNAIYAITRGAGVTATAAIQAPEEAQHEYPSMRLASAVRAQPESYAANRLVEYRDAVYASGLRENVWADVRDDTWAAAASRIALRFEPGGREPPSVAALVSSAAPTEPRERLQMRLSDLVR